jgi:hypothetical protein
MRLLIVEDDKDQLQMYKDSIDSFSKSEGIKVASDVFETIDKGMDALNHNSYDAAIIDLKLSSNSLELEGMALVNAINGKLRIPIYIVSGSIEQVEISENKLFQKRLRTDNFKNILKEIKNIYDTGITSFLVTGGIIDNNLTKIFWNHLSKDLDIWIKHNNPNNLLRYILSHFQEHLEINLQGDFEEYHPFEVYIKPPIKMNLHTGDLIKYNNEHYVILTPACDIVIQCDGSRNADNIIIVKALNFDYKTNCLNKNKELDKNKISKYVKNSNARFHYLPPFEGNNGFIVDFQDITSIDFTTELERVATVSSPFIKDIISRFANYYSRQGQPTFNQDAIVEELFNKK